MKRYKRYVSIIQFVDKNGKVTPKTLIWENNMKYTIDRVLEIRNAASCVGGYGLCYRCRIAGVERNLFFEDQKRWFIESLKP